MMAGNSIERRLPDTERDTGCISVSSASEEEAVFIQEEEGATEGQTFPATRFGAVLLDGSPKSSLFS
ncbi:hypothetical protein SLEP1_g39491 [Rubroshorea leprosula]|uniref:Uncharacterized protein n=1 Tax=Rubroshorea leprosula TaxID=152421 RepID=A0AAV5L102_9ROSI|nr:hypothetical protein SLEP1_g39491 [Rubroshorea leprosula]